MADANLPLAPPPTAGESPLQKMQRLKERGSKPSFALDRALLTAVAEVAKAPIKRSVPPDHPPPDWGSKKTKESRTDAALERGISRPGLTTEAGLRSLQLVTQISEEARDVAVRGLMTDITCPDGRRCLKILYVCRTVGNVLQPLHADLLHFVVKIAFFSGGAKEMPFLLLNVRSMFDLWLGSLFLTIGLSIMAPGGGSICQGGGLVLDVVADMGGKDAAAC
ncbi:hypothetical protein AK812_SmicGene25584 [Symbiodinium microadriaticum]|uniref:Uncharacterized protein n=1 Tax=Symbiodinium microadriaticum TaxID=2951 RepID=A0A1Q9DBP6_SYMMI|nr:hypothetical protein AK812_SmicGene25584 [Symbiodinium microadriaticum]